MVVLGAAVGAPLRYLADRFVQARHASRFPFGTLTVNLVASLVFGLVTALAASGNAGRPVVGLIGTGFCGALSTYSTYAFETLRELESGRRRIAVANVVVSVLVGLGAAALGWVIGTHL
jgi:CrcB protein